MRIQVTFIFFLWVVQESLGQLSAPIPVADMHYHLTMKAHNVQNPDLVNEKKINGLKFLYGGKIVRPKSPFLFLNPRGNNLKKYTEATLPHAQEGNLKLAFNSISPFEHNLAATFGDRVVHKFFKSQASFTWLRKIGSKKWVSFTHYENYFQEYCELIDFGVSHPGSWKYWTGTENRSDLAGHQLYVVNVIEGGHSLQGNVFDPDLKFLLGLLDDFPRTKKIQASNKKLKNFLVADPMNKKQVDPFSRKKIQDTIDDIKRELSSNIKYIKSLDVPVFMVTMGHLGYNGMVGSALALDGTGLARLVASRFFRSRVSHDNRLQAAWQDKFMSPPEPTVFGKYVIDELISSKNGNKIFIDLKHSGYPSRNWFYKNRADSTPPICSHCAVNGLSNIHFSVTTDEYGYSQSKEIKKFYPFSLNLYDEEIEEYFKKDGIIGITLEERILGGYQNSRRKKEVVGKIMRLNKEGVLNELKVEIKAELELGEGNSSDRICKRIICDDYYNVEPFLDNLFYILDHSSAVDHRLNRDMAWSHICLGSDLDGIIDPLDIIPTASQYPYFFKRLKQFIPIYLNVEGKKPEKYFESFNSDWDEEIDCRLRQLFYSNLSDFVAKNFRK